MKPVRFALTFLLFAYSCNVMAMNIRGSHSGSWYNPDQSGHGLSVQVLDSDTMVIYWFVYHPDGTPTFLTSLASIAGDTAAGNVFQYSGMRFGEFDPASIVKEHWGTLSLTFSGCDTALLSYDSTLSYKGVPFGSGDIEMTRLTSIDGMECILPEYGIYTATLSSAAGGEFAGASYITILENGDMAYRATGDRYFEGYFGYELGFGRIGKTAEDTFRFYTMTRKDDLEFVTREGSVVFNKGEVSLDLGELGTLVGSLKAPNLERLDPASLAGTYFGWFNHPMLPAYLRYEISSDGRIVAGVPWCEAEGWLSIPDPASNQLVYEVRGGASEQNPECGGSVSIGIGAHEPKDGSIYLIVSDKERDYVWDVHLELEPLP